MIGQSNVFFFMMFGMVAIEVTSAYRTEGFPCRANFQCGSSYCNGTRQCDSQKDVGAVCPEGVHDACLSGRCDGGVCQVQKQANETCNKHEDCFEGYCDPVITICTPWKARKELCEFDFECRSGRCTNNPRVCEFVIYEPNICGKDADCHGDRCKKEGGLNQCYARKWNERPCHHNDDCFSLRCEAQNCTEPVWLGEPCDEPSDCYSLFCNQEKGICVQTFEEAKGDEVEPELPGISGSEAAEIIASGGNIDLNPPTGNAFGEQSQTDGDNGGGSSGFSHSLQATMTAASAAMLGMMYALH